MEEGQSDPENREVEKGKSTEKCDEEEPSFPSAGVKQIHREKEPAQEEGPVIREPIPAPPDIPLHPGGQQVDQKPSLQHSSQITGRVFSEVVPMVEADNQSMRQEIPEKR